MDFLRLYLGEIVSLVLALVIFFVAAAIASRYYMSNRRLIRIARNICVAAALAAAVFSWTYSLALNRTPRAQIDRSAAEQDQKAFELRHSDQKN